MSMYVSYAPVLEHTALENASAFPQAPQRAETERPARPRVAVAALLRRAAALELAVARRLERPAARRPVAA